MGFKLDMLHIIDMTKKSNKIQQQQNINNNNKNKYYGNWISILCLEFCFMCDVLKGKWI